MIGQIPVPKTVSDVLARAWTKHEEFHPGLLLDKLAPSWLPPEARPDERKKFQETFKKECLNNVIACKADEALLTQLRNERKRMLDRLGATVLHATTRGPLTLHLARASALENVGICLHPIHGFVYLPGSGVKGMARAFAQTIWKKQEQNQAEATKTIRKVFGYAEKKDAAAGALVFHDAWPVSWPTLELDILNSHHSKYYSAPENDVPPPGDWESPIIVNFLSIGKNVEFDFALSSRQEQADAGLMKLARQWLAGALLHLGAGAKTNAGYGTFEVQADNETLQEVKKWWTEANANQSRATFSCTLALVTPAFLAGANQGEKDCDLRPATLRGQLRWWWRTMHAGYMNVATLRKLESAIWGSAEIGGAVKISLTKGAMNTDPIESPFKETYPNREGTDSVRGARSFAEPRGIVPQGEYYCVGLGYLGYGMDEMSGEGEDRKRNLRWCLEKGAWKLTIVCRPAKFESHKISAAEVLKQVRSALYLLENLGGIGSKSRKGFGSLFIQGIPILQPWWRNGSFPACRRIAGELRKNDLSLKDQFSPADLRSPSIAYLLSTEFPLIEIPLNTDDAWAAIDKAGIMIRNFFQTAPNDCPGGCPRPDAADRDVYCRIEPGNAGTARTCNGHGKHCLTKLAFGLPRKIDGPGRTAVALPIISAEGNLNGLIPTNPLIGPNGLPSSKELRHAAPWLLHFFKGEGGNLWLRLSLFPAKYLPSLPESSRMLKLMRDYCLNRPGCNARFIGGTPVSSGEAKNKLKQP